MIRFARGDLLNSDAEALVNTVNCVGIMGRGIALQFKKMYPANFSSYAAACAAGEVVPGKMYVHHTGEMTNPKYIINFPTKRHWKGNSKLEDIESGLFALREELQRLKVKSVAIPPLGSGLGGLPWPAVKARIIDALESIEDVDILVFEPHADSDRMARHKRKSAPQLTPYRAALVSIMDRYVRGLMEPYVTLLEVHKLVYFLQTSGLPMRLRFVKGHYGPYADNLRHVLSDMEGYYTAGYGDGGDQPFKKISLVPTAVEEAAAVLSSDVDTERRLEGIDRLIEGFETPVGLELLATTHWAATEIGSTAVPEIKNFCAAWNVRKSSFTERQIGIAIARLIEEGWLSDA
ncbi:macro domain-containing protein [Sphingomonas sinipercae]|uniref:Macro domain-containing protein n=1 Tax=Sphingomonas sinipercae TaxID=2714944 RepID=A0A6G7ZKU3_9SPHN|nr:macro domain-containing protein [Sphingomonas sinipercae]QIL01617.1 macro domain-containing protein [Sphingomonas sinipercae]